MKRKLISLKRIIKAGIINLGRNLSLAIAAVAVMVVTLTGVLLSLLANSAFTNTINDLTGKIDISMYVSDGIPVDAAKTLTKQLQKLPDVKSAEYISKEQALKDYQAANQDNTGLQEAISQTDNPLPASIRIQPIDPNNIQNIKTFLDKPENIALQDPQAGTSYSGDRKTAIDKITNATNVLARVGLIAVIVFASVSVLIIFNTIQMAIFNRRDELTIMRLLGASNSFIRGPFIVESMLYGIIAALVSVLLIHSVFVVSSSALQASSLGLLDINFAAEYFREHLLLILLMQLGVGILIGAASSTIATRRYLKFKTK